MILPLPSPEPPRSAGSSSLAASSLFAVWYSLSEPFMPLFDRSATWAKMGSSVLLGIVILATWALFGAAITRTAALRLTQDERGSMRETLRFCLKRWSHYFFAPLCPLIPVVCFAILMVPAGWLMKLGPGAVLVGIFWPLLLVGGLMSAFLLIGVLFGWPLMWATISTEGTDGFDAMSRSYSYLYQRPLQYLFYAVVALGFGSLGFTLVLFFAAFVIELSVWAVSWGAGDSLATGVLPAAATDASGLSLVGVGIARFWIVGVKLVALSFAYSYFWVASSAIYLLLRRDTDAKEMDEVFVEGGVVQVAAGLPDLTLDETGAPVVTEAPDGASGDASEDARGASEDEA